MIQNQFHHLVMPIFVPFLSEKTPDESLEVKENVLLDKAEDIEIDEKEFWREIIQKYLSPTIKEDTKKQNKLIDLRNSVYAGFVMINLIYITIVFVVTQTNDLNDNVFTFHLPCPNRSGSFDVDPISVVFIVSFGFVLFFQMIGMIIHRFSTFTHIVAVSKIFEKSCKRNVKQKSDEKKKNETAEQKTNETDKEKKSDAKKEREGRHFVEKKWKSAIERIFDNQFMGDRKSTMEERAQSEFHKSMVKVIETTEESDTLSPNRYVGTSGFSGSTIKRSLKKNPHGIDN